MKPATENLRRRVRLAGTAALRFLGVFAILSAGSPALAQVRGGLDEETARDLLALDPSPHIRRLAAIPSRVSGYPGCREAEQYVLDSYRSMGLANIKREPFQIVGFRWNMPWRSRAA